MKTRNFGDVIRAELAKCPKLASEVELQGVVADLLQRMYALGTKPDADETRAEIFSELAGYFCRECGSDLESLGGICHCRNDE